MHGCFKYRRSVSKNFNKLTFYGSTNHGRKYVSSRNGHYSYWIKGETNEKRNNIATGKTRNEYTEQSITSKIYVTILVVLISYYMHSLNLERRPEADS